jgi:hypothetical protein
MTKTISFPSELKEALSAIATEQRYPLVREILARGKADELVLKDKHEAQVIVDVARVQMLEAGLRYPYWNEDSTKYNKAHDEAFQDVQMGLFEKVVTYVGQEFEVVTRI